MQRYEKKQKAQNISYFILHFALLSLSLYSRTINNLMVGRVIICGLLFSMNVAGQEVETTDSMYVQGSVSVQDSTKTLMGRLRQLQAFLDKKAKKKVDPNYIEVPDKPWRVMLRYKASMVQVDYDNSMVEPNAPQNRLDWNLCFKPPVSASVGFLVGYRGTSLSYSFPITKKSGRHFSISSTGAKYGFNFRLRRFSTDETTFSTKLTLDGKTVDQYSEESHMPSAVWIRSVYVNGYYVFNGRRYSQAAAYNQSVIQRRSAGSFLVGATWYQSSFDYSDMENERIMFFGNNVNRIKLHQANIGVGYGFNWVPVRGLVVNLMAMPTVSVYNRVKVYKYKSNFDFFGAPDSEDYGTWNPETHKWANGKEQKPLEMAMNESNDFEWLDELELWGNEEDVTYSMMKFNVDLRMGIAYNWKNWFTSAQAQFNNFYYSKDECNVNLFDAYARFTLGVRF